jgi:hypothetical protein
MRIVDVRRILTRIFTKETSNMKALFLLLANVVAALAGFVTGIIMLVVHLILPIVMVPFLLLGFLFGTESSKK